MAPTSTTRATVNRNSADASRHGVLRAAWSDERAAARSARGRGDLTAEWKHLERAHILSQPMAGAHVRTHLVMLACALRRRRSREVVGQMLRLGVGRPR